MKLRNLLVGMVVVAALSAGGVAAAGHYHTTQWWVNGLGDGHNNNNYLRPEVTSTDGYPDEKYADIARFGNTLDWRGPTAIGSLAFDVFPNAYGGVECEFDTFLYATDVVDFLPAHVHDHEANCQ